MQETSQSKTSSCDPADYDAEQDKLICMLCGFRSNQLGRHLIAAHEINSTSYKIHFPGARTSRLTNDQIDRMRQTKNAKDSLHKRNLAKKAERRQELEASQKPKIECFLCDFKSMSSIISHITHRHKMTLSEYRLKFPGAIVQRMCDSQREKMDRTWKSEDRIQKLLTNRSYPSEIKHWTRQGFDDEEAKKLVTEYQKDLSSRQNKTATKSRQVQRSTGHNNPMSLRSIAKRNSVEEEAARSLTPCFGRIGEKHPMFGKQHTQETLEKISKNAPRHFFAKSSAEKELYENLTSLGYNVSRNLGVSRYNCDIVFSSIPLIVEYFGDYWHCNPGKWNACQFNSRIKMTAEERWRLDRRKIEDLESLGYKVMVIWENDWKKNSQCAIKEIVDAANSIS